MVSMQGWITGSVVSKVVFEENLDFFPSSFWTVMLPSLIPILMHYAAIVLPQIGVHHNTSQEEFSVV